MKTIFIFLFAFLSIKGQSEEPKLKDYLNNKTGVLYLSKTVEMFELKNSEKSGVLLQHCIIEDAESNTFIASGIIVKITEAEGEYKVYIPKTMSYIDKTEISKVIKALALMSKKSLPANEQLPHIVYKTEDEITFEIKNYLNKPCLRIADSYKDNYYSAYFDIGDINKITDFLKSIE